MFNIGSDNTDNYKYIYKYLSTVPWSGKNIRLLYKICNDNKDLFGKILVYDDNIKCRFIVELILKNNIKNAKYILDHSNIDVLHCDNIILKTACYQYGCMTHDVNEIEDFILYLIALGANTNDIYCLKSVIHKKLEIVKIFFNDNTHINMDKCYILEKISYFNNYEVLEYLLESGLQLSPYVLNTMHMYYNQVCDTKILEIFIDHGLDRPTLNYLLGHGVLIAKYSLVKKCLDAGADISFLIDSCLQAPIQKLAFDVVQLLSDYGVDFTILNKLHEEHNFAEDELRMIKMVNELGVKYDIACQLIR